MWMSLTGLMAVAVVVVGNLDAAAATDAQPLAGVWDVAYGSTDYQRIQEHDEATHGKALKKEGALEDIHAPDLTTLSRPT